ncbi:hypothetical protein [Aureimonas sp. ME7]|uniref:hypothetical protein n=1 Tax=Aureimonas sp. ME7 TaxID=2744252 RepID=UPI0015F5DFB9|nr:hypothetical protein [Aureimonas sp. ME7]
MLNDRTGAYGQLLADVRAEIAAARRRLDAAQRELDGLLAAERHLAAISGNGRDARAAAPEAEDPTIDPARERPPAPAAGKAPVTGADRPHKPRQDSESFAAGVRRVAREAIGAAGRPLNRAKIFEAVSQAGIGLPERNASKKISKILAADDGLENVRGEGYAVRR